jgi:hypothetical protein
VVAAEGRAKSLHSTGATAMLVVADPTTFIHGEVTMKRRDFLAASCFAGMASVSGLAQAKEGDASPAKQLFELRHYHLEAGQKAERFAEFLGQVAVPAFNRIGIKPVGVFRIEPEDGTQDPNIYVLIPHCCFESVMTATAKLLADEEYMKAGADVVGCAKNDPAFTRVESSLSLAFDHCPKVEVPTKEDSRVLQLRIYESHNQFKAKKKVHMFNEGGEIDIFRRTGLDPVFFGETLIGTRFPNLTYMLGFDNMEAKEAAWKAFISHPDWKECKSRPEYADTVSNITNIMLRPVAGSQI